MFTKSQDSTATEFSNALVPGKKKPFEAGRSDCSFKFSCTFFIRKFWLLYSQAAQTLFVIYIRDSIALRFEPFKRMYENGSKIALNSTCSKGFK